MSSRLPCLLECGITKTRNRLLQCDNQPASSHKVKRGSASVANRNVQWLLSTLAGGGETSKALSEKSKKEALGFCHQVQSWCKHDPIGKQGAPGMILLINHAWTNAGRRKASLSRRTINCVLYNRCVKIFGKVSKELPALSWLTKKWFWRKTSSEQEQKYTLSVGFAEGLHPSRNQSLSGIWSVTPMRVDSRSLLTSVTELGWENPSVKTGFWSSV